MSVMSGTLDQVRDYVMTCGQSVEFLIIINMFIIHIILNV